MTEFLEVVNTAGNAGTAIIAYILWRHEMRLMNLERVKA